jgi:hypothetical protein
MVLILFLRMFVLSFDTIVPLDARPELYAAQGTLKDTNERAKARLFISGHYSPYINVALR